ncbi:MAG TPA: hypothetical protein VLJ39_18385 [Tepidisphaeraceae bacterium]|nr:hypothetical protein [Tepidisphaeraceae bacterium]
MGWITDRFVWLAWSGAFVIAWGCMYWACPRLRQALWRVSLCTAPFGLTEMLFVGRYWAPPVLVRFGGRAPLDVESFLFCFGIGGVAAVLYNVVTRTPLRLPPKSPVQGARQQWYVLAFLFPFLIYLPITLVSGRPLWAGVFATLLGAGVRMALFPSLRTKTAAGGVLFMAYYAAFLALLDWGAPGYFHRVWLGTIAGGRILGVPWAELLFALGVGMYWSGSYEQVMWIFSQPNA